MAYTTIATSSGTNEYTGSIAKLQAIGTTGTGGDGSISRIEFGPMTFPETEYTPSSVITTTVVVPAGTVIEGPIGRFKNAAGSFLIYFNQ